GSALCSASAAGPSAGLSASACAADTGCGLVRAVRDFAAAAAAGASSALSRCATSCDTAPPADGGASATGGVAAVAAGDAPAPAAGDAAAPPAGGGAALPP